MLEVKHKRNITFLGERKIVRSCMEKNTYASVAQRVDPIHQDNKYRAMVEKLIQLEKNDWPKIQKHLKNSTPPNFNKHKLNDEKSQIKRNPMR